MLQTFAQGRLFGVRTGSSTPRVLALHGWRRTHRDFDTVLGTGPSGGEGQPLDALAPDLPGFGATPPPPGVWGTDDYAELVAELLDEMEAPVVLLGHSFGGRVAVRLAAEHPERVAGAVLTGVPLVRLSARRRPPARYRVTRQLHALGLVGDATMEAARRRHGSADYRAAEGIMRQVLVRTLAESYDDELDAITCPVTLVWGDDDAEVPLAVGERTAARLAHGELVVCPGAGHLTPLTVPGVLRRAVLGLLA
ncbi:MAG TPA: alpha/beta hydrolase [Acidimicrobiales bacterium]|nr:alpha/beta hydrolase [Acidimicrobiales bacterium]